MTCKMPAAMKRQAMRAYTLYGIASALSIVAGIVFRDAAVAGAIMLIVCLIMLFDQIVFRSTAADDGDS